MQSSSSRTEPLSQRPTTRLTREGFQFVFLLMFVWLAAILQNVNLLVLLSGAFCAMLLIHWRVATATLGGLSVHRFVQNEVQARRPFTVILSVTNPRTWLASWILMVHENFSTVKSSLGLWLPGHGITLMIDRLLPGQTRELTYQCVAPLRGEYRFEPPELSTRFPLTLMRGRLLAGNESKLTVFPTIGSLTHDWRRSIGLPQEGQMRRSVSMAGGDGEFYGLRNYRPGDTPRWIHWRTSARRNELLVRQFEREEKQSLLVVLDLHLGPAELYRKQKSDASNEEAPHKDKNDLVETAIEMFATTLHQIIIKERGHAMVAVVDHRYSAPHAVKSTQQMNSLLERLATSKPTLNERLVEVLRTLNLKNVWAEPILVLSVRPRPSWIGKIDVNGRSAEQNASPQNIKEKPEELDLENADRLQMTTGNRSTIRWVDVGINQNFSWFQRGE